MLRNSPRITDQPLGKLRIQAGLFVQRLKSRVNVGGHINVHERVAWAGHGGSPDPSAIGSSSFIYRLAV